MNINLQQHARSELKKDLAKCTKEQRQIFKRMYSPNDLQAPICLVVDSMPCESLDWAMQQVKGTLIRGNKNVY